MEGMIFKLFEYVVAKSNLDPELVGDICLGNVRDARAVYFVRAAALAAGFPNTTAASTANRFCSSSLTATQHIANEIASGLIDVGVAAGAESLSFGNVRLDRPFVDEVRIANQDALDCEQPMGQTSENVGRDFNITREMQDRYAVESYRRAEVAQRNGWFDDEIVPVTVKLKDKEGKESEVTLTKDEGPRWGTTYEKISKLPPSFAEHGITTHAGNASQITDGAAAIVLMKRSKALELGQPILAKYIGTAISGLAPRIMVSHSTIDK